MSKLAEPFEKFPAAIVDACFSPAAFASMAAISSFSLNVFFTWLKQVNEEMRQDIVRMTLDDMYWVLKYGKALFIIELFYKST